MAIDQREFHTSHFSVASPHWLFVLCTFLLTIFQSIEKKTFFFINKLKCLIILKDEDEVSYFKIFKYNKKKKQQQNTAQPKHTRNFNEFKQKNWMVVMA